MMNIRQKKLVVANVHLAHSDPEGEKKIWDVYIEKGFVQSIRPAANRHSKLALTKWLAYFSHRAIDVKGDGLLIPSLCHAHIHLDKCFLLDQCGPLENGTFDEAMKVTANAKARFAHDPDDLYTRGKQLIRDSIAAGVTIIRAHVEVDTTVRFVCLDAALHLKEEFGQLCDLQICVFAQDPLFPEPSSKSLSDNAQLLKDASSRSGVAVVGSAPYVEPSREASLANIDIILDIARQSSLLVDFHLDYNLSESQSPMVHDVLSALRARNWGVSGPHVTLGHCTRWSLFSAAEWAALKQAIGDLPVALVALPQSDMYMMRTPDCRRGTVNVHDAERAGVAVALGVNNVGNAFTPQGSADPLSLAPLGVALYQDATPGALRLLLKTVTTAARAAIAFSSPRSPGKSLTLAANEDGLLVREGDAANLLLLPERASVRAAVLDPGLSRITIRSGRITARRDVTTNVGGELKAKTYLVRGEGMLFASALLLVTTSLLLFQMHDMRGLHVVDVLYH